MASEALTVSAAATDDNLVIKLTTPSYSAATVPTNICIVMDVSGSMNALAAVDGGEGSDGLTVLDMCKHACKTIVGMCGDSDSFGLCTFSDNSQVDIPLTSCTTGAKPDLIKKVESLYTRGRTNIWSGIEEGVKLLEAKRGQNNHLFLLTDGLPNVSPDEGEVLALEAMIDSSSEGLPCAVHMCGFGYNLASKMLVTMSHVGGGSYSFVPDSSVLGSVFVNWTANVQTTMMSQMKVTVSTDGGFAPVKLRSQTLKSCVTDPVELKERRVELASASYDQPRFVSLDIPSGSVAEGAEIDVKIEYVHWADGRQDILETIKVGKADAEMMVAPLRIEAADACLHIAEAVGDDPQAMVDADVDAIRMLTGKARSLGIEGHALGEGLIKDLEGQMAEATSRGDWFGKWGRHYLPSLALAHFSQRSNNFKDGVQAYGSDMFNDLVDSGGEIFTTLELKASRQSYGRAAPATASAYYNPSGVCFAPEARVMALVGNSAQPVPISSLTKGARVVCQDGRAADVLCTVQSPAPADGLIKIGGVRMTAWHPVAQAGQWVAARDAEGAALDTAPVAGGQVWNLVLSGGHNVVLVGEGATGEQAAVVAATLGHNMADSPAVAHAFFGTDAVVRALEGCNGWDGGHVQLQGVYRDWRTSEVVGVVSA